MREERLELPPSSLIALYTDGLVEHRDRDLDAGIEALRRQIDDRTGALDDLPLRLVDTLLPDGPDDDVAVLLARIDPRASEEESFAVAVPSDVAAIATRARRSDDRAAGQSREGRQRECDHAVEPGAVRGLHRAQNAVP